MDRKYPKISENDYVRIKINQKKTAKGHDPTFTKEKHKVVAIRNGEYYIPSYHKHRLFNRHELLKVRVIFPTYLCSTAKCLSDRYLH